MAQAPSAPASYAMCYAISAAADPLGPYYRYAFERPLFPDYPRPAVWPDGYYLATSTGDDVIEKHTCVVDRASMLEGRSATEQCIVIDGVNFLNNADLDGEGLPPPGAPNIMMATGARSFSTTSMMTASMRPPIRHGSAPSGCRAVDRLQARCDDGPP